MLSFGVGRVALVRSVICPVAALDTPRLVMAAPEEAINVKVGHEVTAGPVLAFPWVRKLGSRFSNSPISPPLPLEARLRSSSDAPVFCTK